MKKLSLVFPLVLSLAACGPVSVYHKPGGAVAQRKSDLLSCEVAALDQAPVATQIRQAPPRYIPSRRRCYSDGTCYSEGGFFTSGEVYTVDVNASLRRRLTDQCMTNKGYTRIELPRCRASGSDATDTSGLASPVAPAPGLSPDSCVFKDAAGDWQIATQ